MSGPFGPQGRRIEKPTHEEELERFTRAFGFQPEPEVQPEDIPIERDLAVGEKSMLESYYLRHPSARPKPKQLLKNMGAEVAPGTKAGTIVEKLLEQLKTLQANYAIFEEKVNALEAKIDPCVESHGKNFRSVDGECVKISPGHLDPAPAPVPPAGMSKDSEIVDGIMNKILAKGKFFRKTLILDEPWQIVS